MKSPAKIFLAAFFAVLFVGAVSAFADPITHVSADTVYTYFDPNEGPGLGRLDFEQITPVEFDCGAGVCDVYEGAYIHIWTDLVYDNPSGDLASGHFEGGEFVIRDEFDNVLLEGDVEWLDMAEVFDDVGFMSGMGFFKITGGDLKGEFGNMGEICSMSFQLNPRDIDDFSEYFDGNSDLTIMPMLVPEPSTITMIFASFLGSAAFVVRKRTSIRK